jgi:hypothetical protein
MPFNLFGPTNKSDIRVGYISTDRGFVDGVSICDANEYAKKNPGTTFIFRTRDIVRYLNINGVNSLTDKDLVTAVDSCTGIELETDCGPPRVVFYGGGGVGVQGNPVIGEDGAVLAVDLVYGGYGYQYPPIVEVRDRCGIGVGAVTRAILGQIVETFEVYDQEGDFEDYELCLPEDVGYGRRYDPDGKDIGSWDPTIYANLKNDPIRIEIQRYQKVLQSLTKPWWTTRKYAPLRVTSGAKVTRTKFDVTDKTYRETQDAKGNTGYVGLGQVWNDFMNTHAISPVPPSNVVGSDFATTLFTFEWEEDFPFDGEYTFRGCADGAVKDLYLDNVRVGSLNSYNESPATFKKNVKSGVHRIRLDLKNGGIYKDVFKPSVAAPAAPTSIQIQREEYVQVDDVFNPPTQRSSSSGKLFSTVANYDNASFHRFNEGTWYKGKRIRNGGDWNNTNPNNNYIQWDGETRLTLGKYHPGNGQRFGIAVWKKKTVTETKNVAAPAAAPPPQTSSSNQTTRSIFNTVDYISRADRRLWRAKPVGPGARDFDFATTYGVLPFNPDSNRAQTESFAGTHVIRWANVDFPVDGNYVIETWVDDNVTLYIGNRSGGGNVSIGNGLKDVNEGGDEVIIRKRGFTANAVSTGKSIDTRFFKAGKYRIRAELNQSDAGPLASPRNPMTLAININVVGSTEKILSPQSWNDNPMGVSLTIDAPLPSLKIPQEPIPEQEGRCPNNPIWSTRFPNAQQRWWPVQYSEVLRANGITPWSDFLNRYAVSPIAPLSLPGTDGGGVVYTNSWQVDIPYDGFYQFAVQRDETARIYLDGNLAFDIKTAGDMIWKDFRNKPKFQKVFITRGRHTISVELENRKTEILTDIDKKVFSSKDWLVPPAETKKEEQRAGSLIIKEGGNYYLLAGGNDLVEISFKFEWDDNINVAGIAASGIKIDTEKGPKVVLSRPNNSSKGSVSGKGTFRTNKKYLITIEGLNSRGKKPEIVDTGPKPDQKQQRINFFDGHGGDVNAKLTTINAKQLSGARVVPPAAAATPTTKNGVTYSGPPLANYLYDFLSPQFADPFTPPAEEIQGKTWVMTWSNVDFFDDGQYTITAKVDDILVIKIDGALINTVKLGGYQTFYVNTTKGKKTVQVELSNLRFPDTGFKQNPTYFSLEITKRVRIGTGVSKSWVENPVAISAILIPPPCPKRIRGKGVVVDVLVDDPGNGYSAPQNDLPPEISGTYPTSLRLKNIVVENPGINYAPGDPLIITPDNGAILEPVLDTFGRVASVNILNPGLGFTRYPDIRIDSPTGVNAVFRPQFEVIRDPIVSDPDKLIQVTDLVGLKQTGYVDGRAYFGAVFYKEGVRYAGFYETPGDLVQVYDTLQESIDAQVTTPPSAIQRQGTDISSNDPRLNLPNTPENLI